MFVKFTSYILNPLLSRSASKNLPRLFLPLIHTYLTIDIFIKETAVATSTRLDRTGHWKESANMQQYSKRR